MQSAGGGISKDTGASRRRSLARPGLTAIQPQLSFTMMEVDQSSWTVRGVGNKVTVCFTAALVLQDL